MRAIINGISYDTSSAVLDRRGPECGLAAVGGGPLQNAAS
jgi:hypothetical protein